MHRHGLGMRNDQQLEHVRGRGLRVDGLPRHRRSVLHDQLARVHYPTGLYIAVVDFAGPRADCGPALALAVELPCGMARATGT